jgi:hypothetical protein
MRIKYLTLLRDNPAQELESSEYYFPNQAMSLDEIKFLEQKYNNGKKFPQALRELLFLSGNRSYVMDVVFYPKSEETPNPQDEYNEYIREELLYFNNNIMPITRPFYIFGGGSGSGVFEFVYLDEGDDPPTYQSVKDYTEQTRDWEEIGNTMVFDSITQMTEIRIENKLRRNGVPIIRK